MLAVPVTRVRPHCILPLMAMEHFVNNPINQVYYVQSSFLPVGKNVSVKVPTGKKKGGSLAANKKLPRLFFVSNKRVIQTLKLMAISLQKGLER